MTQLDMPIVQLDVLLTRDPDCWVAHCLQLDIVTASPDLATVEDDIVKVCKAQVVFAFEHDCLEGLFRPPNQKVSAEILRGLSGEGVRLSVTSTIAEPTRLEFRMQRKAA